MKIWHKYLFKKIASTFSFILIATFSIYLLIDLSTNGIHFAKTNFNQMTLYYIHSFSTLLDLFIPLAFLLAVLKVLFDLSSHLEILSLEMAGLSKKRILTPLFVFAFLLTCFCYANHEWIGPESSELTREYKLAHSNKKNKTNKQVYAIEMPDQTQLVYQNFDAEKNELADVFWIESDENFWHMKNLSLATRPATARFVDHFQHINGKLEKTESFDERQFESIDVKPKAFRTFESRKLSDLLVDSKSPSTYANSIQTHLHHKLAIPLLSLLILMTTAPFALRVSRDRPSFRIVALSLFAFVAAITLFDGLLVLGENNVIRPWIAMWLIPFAISICALRRWVRL